jgi:hypothetical protein
MKMSCSSLLVSIRFRVDVSVFFANHVAIGAFVSTAAAFAVWVVFHRAVFFRILARLLLLFCD